MKLVSFFVLVFALFCVEPAFAQTTQFTPEETARVLNWVNKFAPDSNEFVQLDIKLARLKQERVQAIVHSPGWMGADINQRYFAAENEIVEQENEWGRTHPVAAKELLVSLASFIERAKRNDEAFWRAQSQFLESMRSSGGSYRMPDKPKAWYDSFGMGAGN